MRVLQILYKVNLNSALDTDVLIIDIIQETIQIFSV